MMNDFPPAEILPAKRVISDEQERDKQSKEDANNVRSGGITGTTTTTNESTSKKKAKVGPTSTAIAVSGARPPSGSTKKATGAGSRPPAPGADPFPKPKNFPERLMNGLQKGIASESVFWADNGKSIGVYKESLECNPYLASHYKAKDHSGFIRNCNRWGFNRVNVEDGVSYYRNSLFQRGLPHLVKFMKMDSDVQEVFSDYLKNGGSTQPNPNELAKIYAQSRGRKGGNKSSSPSSTTTGLQQQGGGGAGTDGTSTTMIGGSGINNNNVVVDAALLSSQVAAATAGGPNNNNSNLSKEFILRKILQLTDQFLKHRGSLYSDDKAFKMTLQRLKTQGQRHEQDLKNNGQMDELYLLDGALKPTTTTTTATTNSSSSRGTATTVGVGAPAPTAPTKTVPLCPAVPMAQMTSSLLANTPGPVAHLTSLKAPPPHHHQAVPLQVPQQAPQSLPPPMTAASPQQVFQPPQLPAPLPPPVAAASPQQVVFQPQQPAPLPPPVAAASPQQVVFQPQQPAPMQQAAPQPSDAPNVVDAVNMVAMSLIRGLQEQQQQIPTSLQVSAQQQPLQTVPQVQPSAPIPIHQPQQQLQLQQPLAPPPPPSNDAALSSVLQVLQGLSPQQQQQQQPQLPPPPQPQPQPQVPNQTETATAAGLLQLIQQLQQQQQQS